MNNIEILEHIAIAYIDDEEFSQYVSPEGRFITNKQLAQSLENLIQENKELEEKNKKIVEKTAQLININRNVIKENFISKSKVKEKIKELDKKMAEDEVDEFGIHSQGWAALDWTRDFLLELLGGE